MKMFIVFIVLLFSLFTIAGNIICAGGQTRRAVPSPYNPVGKIDPFQPISSYEPTRSAPTVNKTDCVPIPVLEGMDISQLKLSGIVLTEGQPIALFQEANGKGHILKENVCFGRHGGKVESILNDRIIIREEMLSSTGQLQVKKIELELKRR